MSDNKPIETLRDGRLKASIWMNESKETGLYLTATISRTYTDDKGQARDTHALNQRDLLPASDLARRAHVRCNELRRELSQSREQDRKTDRSQPSREFDRSAAHERSRNRPRPR